MFNSYARLIGLAAVLMVINPSTTCSQIETGVPVDLVGRAADVRFFTGTFKDLTPDSMKIFVAAVNEFTTEFKG